MLLLVFVMLTLGLFALFLGGSLVAQGYLYQQPAERLPVRALVAAALVGGFVTLWVLIDRRAPGRYDTFFRFEPVTTVEFPEFEAVRWMGNGGALKLDARGNPTETTVKFKRSVGGKGSQFVEEGSGNKFEMHGTTSAGGQYMVGAIRVKGPTDPEPVRYNATLKDDPRSKTKTYTPERKFVEEKGSRYVEAQQLGTLFVPSTGTIVLALLVNFMLLVVLLVAFWPVLRFSLGHAVVLAGAFAVVMMLGIMPILFKQNRVPAAAQAAGRQPSYNHTVTGSPAARFSRAGGTSAKPSAATVVLRFPAPPAASGTAVPPSTFTRT